MTDVDRKNYLYQRRKIQLARMALDGDFTGMRRILDYLDEQSRSVVNQMGPDERSQRQTDPPEDVRVPFQGQKIETEDRHDQGENQSDYNKDSMHGKLL